MENMRVYSMNLVSYILCEKDMDYDTGIDNSTGNVYFVFEDDVSDIVKKYRADSKIQNFIEKFKNVKGEIWETKTREKI